MSLSLAHQHILLVFRWWFVRWEVSGRITDVLFGTASRICSKLSASFFCSFHLTFSPSISLNSKWCNHTILLTRLTLGRNPVLFDQRDLISIWSINCQLRSVIYLWFKQMRYCYLSIWTRLLISEACYFVIWFLKKLCFIWVHMETNASCCQHLPMQQRFGLSMCICEKP